MWGFTFPAIIESLGNWNFADKLTNVKMPVLFVHGTYDYVPMEAAKEWNKFLPNSRLWKIKNVGHLPFSEKTEEIMEGMNIFLNGKWPKNAK